MYQVDQATGDIVINGLDQGIGQSPYSGLTDAKSVNLSSIPTEAAVNFSTQTIASPAVNGVVVTGLNAFDPVLTFTGATGLENGMVIEFSNIGSLTGCSIATPYWVYSASSSGCSLMNYNGTTSPSLGGTPGGATFNAVTMDVPQYFAKAKAADGTPAYYLVDKSGLVWTNDQTTPSGYWEYTGNTTPGLTNATGNGLVYYEVTGGGATNGYLFVFRQLVADYIITNAPSHGLSWTYGWVPGNGTGNTSGLDGSSINRFATVLPDNRVYFCNGSNIQKFFQTAPGTIFDPTNTATYTYASYPLLPINDKSQCIAPLGTNALIGAQGNVVYLWDTVSTLISNPILLPEANTVSIVTVNTNAYLFTGNKGNIYITNGSQASPFKKVPDHISNTVEPYFQWGGATYQKNRLYFGVYATNNAGTYLGGYSGVWCIDLNTNAIYLSNQLSFGSYNAGYASALIAIPAAGSALSPGNNPAGVGLYVGWSNGTIGGADKTVSSLYTGGQSYIISDFIPVGTLLKPTTLQQLEFKLATPLLAGEKIELQLASALSSGTNPTFTSALITNGDGSLLAGNSQNIPIQALQWVLIKAILTGGTIATPSFNRLTEMRIIGGTALLKGISLSNQ